MLFNPVHFDCPAALTRSGTAGSGGQPIAFTLLAARDCSQHAFVKQCGGVLHIDGAGRENVVTIHPPGRPFQIVRVHLIQRAVNGARARYSD